jgi:hypothetical protein
MPYERWLSVRIWISESTGGYEFDCCTNSGDLPQVICAPTKRDADVGGRAAGDEDATTALGQGLNSNCVYPYLCMQQWRCCQLRLNPQHPTRTASTGRNYSNIHVEKPTQPSRRLISTAIFRTVLSLYSIVISLTQITPTPR